LWDLCQEVSMTGAFVASAADFHSKQDVDLATDIKRIKFLIVDEADRMIETGHFAELEQIVALTERTQQAM
jgi:superfamily II DNA/RNA helicase